MLTQVAWKPHFILRDLTVGNRFRGGSENPFVYERQAILQLRYLDHVSAFPLPRRMNYIQRKSALEF